jgi:putative transposase
LGLVTHDVLFVIDLAARRVVGAGITPYPDATGILQIARDLTDAFSGFFLGKAFPNHESCNSFYAEFRGLLESVGVQSVRSPARSPKCNAHLEQFHGSFEREVADRDDLPR